MHYFRVIPATALFSLFFCYTQMNSNFGNLAQLAPQIWGNEIGSEQLGVKQAEPVETAPKIRILKRSQKPNCEFVCEYTPKLPLFPLSMIPTAQSSTEKKAYLSQNIEQGKKLIFSDDSAYEIAPADQDKAAFWISPIEMDITPSSDPDYPYLIHNPLTKTSVKARRVQYNTIREK